MPKLKLTEEGLKYLERGLPEKRLTGLLSKGPLTLEKAKRELKEDFNIAFQWAKVNGWIKLVGDDIILIKSLENISKNDEIEDSLNEIKKGLLQTKDFIGRENFLILLLRRKLIQREKQDESTVAHKYIGKEIDKLTPELIKTGLWKKTKLKSYNVEFVGKKVYPGKRQPYNQFIDSIRRRLIELGFNEVKGQSIVQEFWNFDALFQPQGHPARDWTDVYRLKYPKKGSLPDPKLVERVKQTHENGWKTGSAGWGYKWDADKAAHLMPIAHDTAVSPKTLASKELKIPGKYFQIVRCYRPDVLDATHLVEFNQVGGFIVGEDLNFRNLLGILEMFGKEVAGAKEVKFLCDYYPFTEPSVQLSAKHPELGWIEFAGAGIFREEVTKPLGVDFPVIAWGIGVDRLTMFKLGIKDIRQLFSTDLKWLREQKILI